MEKLALLGMLFGGLLAASVSPLETPVPIEKAYVPVGFDDNDVAQIVVTGEMRSTCYKLGPARLRIAGNRITVNQIAYKFTDRCVRVFVPFTNVVSLGVLEAAEYAIEDSASGAPLGTLSVTAATTSATDDYLYAPVEDAYLRAENGHYTLSLTGHFTDRCTSLREVRVRVYGEIIVVQPIAEHLPGAVTCRHETVRFTQDVPITEPLSAGLHLLHVRIMDGQAINKLVNIP